jgi:hypothetical protein
MAIQAIIESAAQAAPRRKKGLKPKLRIAGPRQARLRSADVAMTKPCAGDADHFIQEHEGSMAVWRFIPTLQAHRSIERIVSTDVSEASNAPAARTPA